MASLRRLWRAYKTCHATNFLQKVSPISTASTKRDDCLTEYLDVNILHGHSTRLTSQYGRLSCAITAALAGLFGSGLVTVSYAAVDEEAGKTPFTSDSSPTSTYLEGLARRERLRLEELLKNKGIPQRFYPKFTVAVKGQKVTIKFQIPPTCEIPRLLARLVLLFGWMLDGSTDSDMLLRAWDSAAAWQLSLTNPKTLNASRGDLHVLMFQSVIPSANAEIEFIKEGSFSLEELEAVASVLQLAGENISRNNIIERKPRRETWGIPSMEKSISSLEALGVRVFGLTESQMSYSDQISWDNIAGYDQQKSQIEDTILLALQSPEVYDDIARGTRNKFESNRPRAVLFEGPPGTGKTSCARVIATQAGVPLVYVPLEVVMSKYYGESERLLGKVFALANDLPDGAIIFLDEVDSFAMTRDNDMHEATRRILSVLLRQIDGFEQDKKVIVIAATNRKQDLDPALMSRFDSVITFNLPDEQNREKIAAQYAKHLTESELVELAKATEGMSGRDIRDVCQQAERHWASKIIRTHAHTGKGKVPLPPLQEYVDSAKNREVGLRVVGTQRDLGHFANKVHLDVS